VVKQRSTVTPSSAVWPATCSIQPPLD
jgi:hypothetical protein